MAKVRLENVYKIYPNGVKAVQDFSLNIQDEEFVVFVGPSGCGKSTSLRMIAGLEEISAGKIYIDDVLVNDLEPKDRDISMVFQNYALYPNMTVFDNMAYGLRCHHIKEDEIRDTVAQTAEILGISEYLNRKPKELSGGQRQRVALGRAIVRKPKVFLLDEPLSNLDAKLRVQMRSEITKLHEKLKTTFIYVTHDQTEAMTMGSKIVVMKDGKIQQADTPLNLYDHPVNTFVATFLGSPEMNLLEGTIAADGGDVFFVAGDLKLKLPDTMRMQIGSMEEGAEVYLGVRPSDIRIAEAGYKTRIELTEQLGNETLCYFYLPGKKEMSILSASEKGIRRCNGDEICLQFDTERIHLFRKSDGLSLIQTDVINKISEPVVKNGETISINGSVLKEETASHFLCDIPDAVDIRIASEKIALEPEENAFKEEISVRKIMNYFSYNVVFAVTKSGAPLVIKTKRSDLKEQEEITAYIPFECADYYCQDKKIYSHIVSKDDEIVSVKVKKTKASAILFMPKPHKTKEKLFLVANREEWNGSLLLKLIGSKYRETLYVSLDYADIYEGQFVFVK